MKWRIGIITMLILTVILAGPKLASWVLTPGGSSAEDPEVARLEAEIETLEGEARKAKLREDRIELRRELTDREIADARTCQADFDQAGQWRDGECAALVARYKAINGGKLPPPPAEGLTAGAGSLVMGTATDLWDGAAASLETRAHRREQEERARIEAEHGRDALRTADKLEAQERELERLEGVRRRCINLRERKKALGDDNWWGDSSINCPGDPPEEAQRASHGGRTGGPEWRLDDSRHSGTWYALYQRNWTEEPDGTTTIRYSSKARGPSLLRSYGDVYLRWNSGRAATPDCDNEATWWLAKDRATNAKAKVCQAGPSKFVIETKTPGGSDLTLTLTRR